MRITLALDAMGGDNAPRIIVEGADIALAVSQQRGISLHYQLFGDESCIEPLLKNYPNLKRNVDLIHTDEYITGFSKPSSVLRGLPRSSMRLAIESVQKGDAQAVISAGNTGALMALSKMLLKTLSGIDRPAIAGPLPTLKGLSLMLDLGANIDRSAATYFQLSVMGHFLAQRLLKTEKPKIGLLNIGSEDAKGDSVIQEAADLLRNESALNFHGFIEGDDICAGTVDVIVTDGFSGNISLKTGEGMVKFLTLVVKESLQSSWRGKLGYLIAKPALEPLKNRLDPRFYNGAVLLGLKKVVIKSHGGTDSLGFSTAIQNAINIVSDTHVHSVGQDIEDYLQKKNIEEKCL